MDDDRLPTAFFLDAHLKQLTQRGIPYYIVNTGAHASGTILLKLYAPGQGCKVLQQQRDLDGVMGWLALFKNEIVAEKDADDYIRRAVDRDPDLWVVEIEDKDMTNPFGEKVF